MSFKPTYEITIGSYLLSSETNNRLVDLMVAASLQVPVNVCRLTLPQLDDMPLEKDMPFSLKLGYNGKNAKVFSGIIHRIEQGLEQTRLTVMSVFRKLTAHRGSSYFDNPTAAAMVLDFCQQLGITPGRVDTGLNFSFYALGEERSYYEHLQNLALQCGFDLYSDVHDHLVFGRPTSLELYAFEAGGNILDLQLYEEQTGLDQVTVYGESPASLGQGTQGASWLTKKEVKGNAGTGDGPSRQVFSPSIRTLENASRMAQSLQQAWKGRKRGFVRVLGSPEIQIGDSIQIKNPPGTGLGGLFKVTGYTHRLQTEKGFISQLNIQEK